jgi:hypothetical protein
MHRWLNESGRYDRRFRSAISASIRAATCLSGRTDWIRYEKDPQGASSPSMRGWLN